MTVAIYKGTAIDSRGLLYPSSSLQTHVDEGELWQQVPDQHGAGASPPHGSMPSGCGELLFFSAAQHANGARVSLPRVGRYDALTGEP